MTLTNNDAEQIVQILKQVLRQLQSQLPNEIPFIHQGHISPVASANEANDAAVSG
jgi:hypothetical protein